MSETVLRVGKTYLRDTSNRARGELVDKGEGLLLLLRHDGRPADLARD